MNGDVKAILEEQLAQVEPGSREQRLIAQSLTDLYKVDLEEEKTKAAYEEMTTRMDNQAKELELKEKQNKRQNILGIAGIAVPSLISLLGMLNDNKNFKLGLLFEKDDSITSSFVRGLSQRIFKKK
jgi:predicted transcriptional regulator